MKKEIELVYNMFTHIDEKNENQGKKYLSKKY